MQLVRSKTYILLAALLASLMSLTASAQIQAAYDADNDFVFTGDFTRLQVNHLISNKVKSIQYSGKHKDLIGIEFVKGSSSYNMLKYKFYKSYKTTVQFKVRFNEKGTPVNRIMTCEWKRFDETKGEPVYVKIFKCKMGIANVALSGQRFAIIKKLSPKQAENIRTANQAHLPESLRPITTPRMSGGYTKPVKEQ